MIKRSGFVVRREDISVEEFRQHWLGVHAPLVRDRANPSGYRVNLVDRDRFPDFPYDGFSELWFEDEAALSAFDPTSPIKRDEANFAARVDVVEVEEHEIVG